MGGKVGGWFGGLSGSRFERRLAPGRGGVGVRVLGDEDMGRRVFFSLLLPKGIDDSFVTQRRQSLHFRILENSPGEVVLA